MPSSPITPIVVDPFDEDEFWDVPTAPSKLMVVLAEVPDTRNARGKRHRLSVVLALAVAAVAAGANSYTAIAQWAASAPIRLLQRLGADRGAPSETTFRRLLQTVDGDRFDALLAGWAATLRRVPTGTRDRVAIAVDGKSVRGARSGQGRCPHLLGIVDQRTGVVLGQLAVDAKTNEIPMFSKVLDHVDVDGVLVTADALHVQTGHARYLHGRGGHYLLTVKNNQPGLRRQLAALPWDQVKTRTTASDRGHGRTEKRTIKVVTVAAGIGFPHAAQAICITRRTRRTRTAKWTTETVYAVTSLTALQASPQQLADWVRGHWTIENRLHWIRDVTFCEDASRIRTGHGPQVMATLRNLTISLLRTNGATNIADARRHHSHQHKHPVKLLLSS